MHSFSPCFSSNHSGSLLISFQLLVVLFQFGFLNFRSLFHLPLPFSSMSGLSSAIHSLSKKKLGHLYQQTTYLLFWVRIFIVFHFQCISHFLRFNVCNLLLFNQHAEVPFQLTLMLSGKPRIFLTLISLKHHTPFSFSLDTLICSPILVFFLLGEWDGVETQSWVLGTKLLVLVVSLAINT